MQENCGGWNITLFVEVALLQGSLLELRVSLATLVQFVVRLLHI